MNTRQDTTTPYRTDNVRPIRAGDVLVVPHRPDLAWRLLHQFPPGATSPPSPPQKRP